MLLARYSGFETRHVGPGRVTVIQHDSTRRMALLFLGGCGLHVVVKAFLGLFSTVIVMLLGVGAFVYSSSMSRQMKDDMQHVTKVRRHAFEEMSRAQAAQVQSSLPRGQHRSIYESSAQVAATNDIRRGTVRSCLGQSRKLPQAERGGTLQQRVGKMGCSTLPSRSSHPDISFVDRLEDSRAGVGRDWGITKTPLVYDTLQDLMRDDPHEGRLQSEQGATMPTSAARQRGTRVYTGRRKKGPQRTVKSQQQRQEREQTRARAIGDTVVHCTELVSESVIDCVDMRAEQVKDVAPTTAHESATRLQSGQ